MHSHNVVNYGNYKVDYLPSNDFRLSCTIENMTDNNSLTEDYIQLFSSGDFSNLITSHWHKPKQAAQIRDFPAELPSILVDFLKSSGYQGLYTHQVDSLATLSQNKNIVVSTGTSSGKTLCYNLPVFSSLLRNPEITALYIFPTKALTEDQFNKINEFRNFLNNKSQDKLNFIKPGIYDGDTNSSDRISIRNAANIILTNPDMLHLGILPHHTSWARYLACLRFIVLDEVHTYRGVFGSHVANVIRRLKRILKFYSPVPPQFILSSATIQNPLELAEKLVEEEFTSISNDGSYQTDRHYFFLNPPVIDRDLGLRRGMIDQSIELVERALDYKIQSIIFGRSRRSIEIAVRQILDRYSPNNMPVLYGYRSGYLPRDRRDIEAGLRSGQINAVISTNAMELGIDMGGVDSVLLMGYPGTIASFLQQSGRAGRRERSSLAVLVASSSPLDQYIIRHPEFIKGKNPEKALLDPDNPLLLINHLRCALFELPFKDGENFGSLTWDQIKPYLDVLLGVSQAFHRNDRFMWMADNYPANEISLRNISGQSFKLRLKTNSQPVLIGEVDFQSAARTVHPEAVYLHNGSAFRVTKLDYDHNEAVLKIHNGKYYTEPKVDTQIELIRELRSQEFPNYSKILSELKVIEQVVGYKRIDWQTREILSHHELDMPENELQTVGVGLKFKSGMVESLRAGQLWSNDANQYGPQWKTIRKQIIARDQSRCQICGQIGDSAFLHVHHKVPFRTFRSISEANRPENLITLCPNCHKLAEQNVRMRSGLAGFAYLFDQITPLHLMCDRHDIGVFTDPLSVYNENQPLLVIYDSFPGGIGLSAELFDKVEDVLENCLEVIQHCECQDGCPACVGPAGENGIGGKEEALHIIEKLLTG